MSPVQQKGQAALTWACPFCGVDSGRRKYKFGFSAKALGRIALP